MSRLGLPTTRAVIDIRILERVEPKESGERTPGAAHSQGLDDLGIRVCYALRRARRSETT